MLRTEQKMTLPASKADGQHYSKDSLQLKHAIMISGVVEIGGPH